MTNIIDEAEHAIVTLWTKVEHWVHDTVEPTLKADEKELMALLQPLFGQAEAALLQDLVVFITAIVASAAKGGDLATLEAAVLNALQATGSSLVKTAESLGSNVLQALIGLVVAKVQK